MHEASIAQHIVDSLSERIESGAVDGIVRRIFLRVGRMTAVVPSNLIFMFEVIAKDTPLDGAILEIEEVPVRCRCGDCGVESGIDGPFFECPACSSGSVEILSGRELVIESLEVE